MPGHNVAIRGFAEGSVAERVAVLLLQVSTALLGASDPCGIGGQGVHGESKFFLCKLLESRCMLFSKEQP